MIPLYIYSLLVNANVQLAKAGMDVVNPTLWAKFLPWLPATILIVIVFSITLGIAAYSTLGERKVAAWMQDRIGPNRAGPGGIFQPLADGLKMLFKEEYMPSGANKILFLMGPGIAILCALMSGILIPWGDNLEVAGKSYALHITDINIGVLYVFGVVSIGVYGLMIGGWSSNNKFSLLGALRASSQVISYELSMGMALIAVLMIVGSLNLTDIVSFQLTHTWMIFLQPLGFLIFLVCAFAECNRTPFDLAECETELVGGYHTEYSGMKLGFFLFSEYINMFVSGAMMATLYFGGYSFPGRTYLIDHWAHPNTIAMLGVAALFGKILFFIFFFMWIRWTIPRFRYDQLMNLGWKKLIPLSIVNLLLTGILMIGYTYYKAHYK